MKRTVALCAELLVLSAGFTAQNVFVACRTPDAPVPAWGDDGKAEDSSDSESSFSDWRDWFHLLETFVKCSCVWSFGRQWFCVDHTDDMVCLMAFLRTKILHVLFWKVWTGSMFQPKPYPHENESWDLCSFYAASYQIHFWFCWNYFVGL